MQRNFLGSVGVTFVALMSAVPAFANQLANSRITLEFDTNDSGTADRVDSLVWIDSQGQATSNLAVSGGGPYCGDPLEFFGQSYGDVDGGGLYLVIAGSSAKWTQKSAASGTSKTTGTDTCAQVVGKTTTAYSLGSGLAVENMMKIKRTFDFSGAALDNTNNLRAYVPRVSVSTYYEVVYPDSTGALQSFDVDECSTACEISDWNGEWVADDDGNGNGIVLIRDPSSTWPAEIAADNDSDSASNLTSILLMRPQAGWSGKLAETEYLCVYDSTSWPAANRANGVLPAGCRVK
jgi:hypothetical protein